MRVALEPELGSFGGECGGATPSPWAPHHRKAPDGPGSAPSRLVPVGKLTLARKNQEEAQMTHCPTSSKVKTQQCVWPLGLDIVAALAPSAAKIKALGQQCMLGPGIQSTSLCHRPIPHPLLHLVSKYRTCNTTISSSKSRARFPFKDSRQSSSPIKVM